MRDVIESGFKVSVPKKSSFRLCECPAYQSLSCLSLKEMDLGWWDTTKKKLILLELKGVEIWQNFDISKDTAHDHLVKSLKEKVIDVLLMLAAVWIKIEVGKKIQTSLPDRIHRYQGDGSAKFIFLIDTPASRKSLLLPVKDAVNKELAGRVRLFGVNQVTLIDFDIAQDMGLPIKRHA